MNILIDSPYNFINSKTASKPIVLPDSIIEKIQDSLGKIERAQKFLSNTPKRKSKTATFFEITPEEDTYMNQGWIFKILVTKRPPAGATLDYREQDKILYVSNGWRPNFKGLYHEVVHAMDPKARPKSEGYIQRDPDTYFKDTPGGYYKVPEEIDAIQSSMVARMIQFSETLSPEQRNVYIENIIKWLKDPNLARTPPAITAWGASDWMSNPKLRKQFLQRLYWALEQIKEQQTTDIEVEVEDSE